jgi:hypothetical protein
MYSSTLIFCLGSLDEESCFISHLVILFIFKNPSVDKPLHFIEHNESLNPSLKDGTKAKMMSTKELFTKLAFFGMRPLRRVAQLNREGVG